MTNSNINGTPNGKGAVLAAAWFREEDYAAALEIMAKGSLMPTYAEWLKRSTEFESEFLKQGFRIVRIMIDPRTFPDWCARNGFTELNAKARSTFAAQELARQKGL